MKKFLAMLLAVIMVLGLFAACGGNDTPDTTVGGNDTPDTTVGGNDTPDTQGGEEVDYVQAPDLSGATIRILTTETWVAGFSVGDVLPRFKQIEELTGCTIEWEAVAADYSTVVQTRLTGDPEDAPDILLLPSNSHDSIKSYIDDGLLYPISQAYDVAPNIEALYNTRTDLKTSFTYTDGEMYVLLANVYDTMTGQAEHVAKSGDNAIWYRGDIAAELGFETYPKTIDELYQLLKAVKEAYPDMVPMHMWNIDCWESVRMFTSAYGLHFNNDLSYSYYYAHDGKVTFEPATDAAKEWVTEMHKWYSEGLVVEGATEEAKIGAAALGTTFSGYYSGVHQMAEDSLQEINPDAYYMYMPFPSKDGYDTTVMGRAAYANATAVIDNGDEDRCRNAVAFLDFAYFSRYGKNSEALGVMGESWYFDENGETQIVEEFWTTLWDGTNEKYANLQATGANIHYNGPSTYSAESRYATKELSIKLYGEGNAYMNDEQYANWLEINAINTSYYQPYFPGFYMSDEDTDTIATLSGDLGTFVGEMLAGYILGNKDLANWQTEFVDVLYSQFHLQEVLDIYQRYYDAAVAAAA